MAAEAHEDDVPHRLILGREPTDRYGFVMDASQRTQHAPQREAMLRRVHLDVQHLAEPAHQLRQVDRRDRPADGLPDCDVLHVLQRESARERLMIVCGKHGRGDAREVVGGRREQVRDGDGGGTADRRVYR